MRSEKAMTYLYYFFHVAEVRYWRKSECVTSKYATLVHWLWNSRFRKFTLTLIFLPKINQEIIFPCEMHTPCIRRKGNTPSPEGTPEETTDKCYSVSFFPYFYPKVATLGSLKLLSFALSFFLLQIDCFLLKFLYKLQL